ncbi:MAG: GNAT family N-acetyltransferase [Pseudomonadota bacterium]
MEFDLQPTLTGPGLTLRPLRPEDRETLWQVARDPLIWDQHPDQTRYQRAGFERFFNGLIASPGALAVVENSSGQIIGVTRYYEWDDDLREITIGHTFLARDYWGTGANREMKQLLIEHARPHVAAIWFHVGKCNLRSQRAMEKLGAVPMHEGQRPQNGVMVDFIYYRIQPAHWHAAH